MNYKGHSGISVCLRIPAPTLLSLLATSPKQLVAEGASALPASTTQEPGSYNLLNGRQGEG